MDVKSCLQNKVVIVRPVAENNAMHIPEGKNGHVRFEGSYCTYCAPLTANNTIKEVLTQEEREYLENLMDSSRPKGWLSAYARKENAWSGNRGFKVELGNDEVVLELSNPVDFIKWKILLSNTEDISPTFENRLDKQYLFYIENKEEMDKNKSELIDSKIKASNLFSEISKSKDKTIECLMVIYSGDTKFVPDEMPDHTAKATLFNFVDSNPKKFIEIVEDVDFKVKGVLYRAMRRGVINRNGYTYNLGMGDGRQVGNGIAEVIAYIKDLSTNNSKQEEYIKFKAALK